MAALLGLFANPLIRKLALYGFLAVALTGGAVWFVHHERAIGAAKVEAAVKAATEAEQAREAKINQDWQAWADGANADADKQKAAIDDMLRKNAAPSLANNGVRCMPADAAARVRAIGRSGGQAGPTAAAGQHQR
jgi:hypothetical protein